MQLDGLRLDGLRLDWLRLDGLRIDVPRINGLRIDGDKRLDGVRLDRLRLDGARLDEHVSGGQGARVNIPLLRLYHLRFDDHLHNPCILYDSLHRGVHLERRVE